MRCASNQSEPHQSDAMRTNVSSSGTAAGAAPGAAEAGAAGGATEAG